VAVPSSTYHPASNNKEKKEHRLCGANRPTSSSKRSSRFDFLFIRESIILPVVRGWVVIILLFGPKKGERGRHNGRAAFVVARESDEGEGIVGRLAG